MAKIDAGTKEVTFRCQKCNKIAHIICGALDWPTALLCKECLKETHTNLE